MLNQRSPGQALAPLKVHLDRVRFTAGCSSETILVKMRYEKQLESTKTTCLS